MIEETLLKIVLMQQEQIAEDRRSFERDKDRFERWLSFVVQRSSGGAEATNGHAANGQAGNGRGGVMRCTGRQAFGRVIDGKPTIQWENQEHAMGEK